jgi:hypothetical protein
MGQPVWWPELRKSPTVEEMVYTEPVMNAWTLQEATEVCCDGDGKKKHLGKYGLCSRTKPNTRLHVPQIPCGKDSQRVEESEV